MKLGNSITVTRMAGSSQHDFAASVVPSIYYMTADNTLKHTAVARTLRPCRAYFQFTDEIGSEARDIRLDFGDSETTEILSTTDFTDYTDKADAVYDLQGLRVKNLRKGGLYIINGRKVVIK